MPATKSKKGRSIVQPGKTLHHFFKTAPHPVVKSNTSISQEIIVIDSDDDDEVEILESTKPVKRRRLSADACSNRNLPETLSDVIPLNTENQSSFASSVNLSDSEENIHLSVEVSNNALPTATENKPVFSFGKPVLLLSSTCPIPSRKDPVQSYSFGQPSALLQSIPARDASHSEQPSVVNHVSEESPSVHPPINNGGDIDLTLEDWDNDDDERPFEFKAEDDCVISGNVYSVRYINALNLRHCSF